MSDHKSKLRTIGIVGLPGAGKTTLLAMLWRAKTESSRQRWYLRARDDETRRFLNDSLNHISSGRAPPRTVGTTRLSLEFWRHRFGGRRFNRLLCKTRELAAADFAGELTARVLGDGDAMGDLGRTFRDVIARSDALLLIVSAGQVIEQSVEIKSFFEGIVAELRRAGRTSVLGRVGIPIAVVLTRADIHRDARTMPERWIGGDASELAAYATTVRCFGVGCYKQATPVVGARDLYHPKSAGCPEEVAEPVDWLLDVLDRRERRRALVQGLTGAAVVAAVLGFLELRDNRDFARVALLPSATEVEAQARIDATQGYLADHRFGSHREDVSRLAEATGEDLRRA
ncbi:50S ribosome-binding GTPase, partial [bacterium]|nr:50S ribosome-binding GTPase [bacterium]